MRSSRLSEQKQFMLQRHLKGRGISDPEVLRAFENVPRERFVSRNFIDAAYDDHPLPIGYGQTISQPYIVAFMVEKLKINPGDSVLEIGTGCGYVTAILSTIAQKVYSVEIIRQLADDAMKRLQKLGYSNVEIHHGDGHLGWEEKAPFDRIIVSAAAHRIPPALTDQLVSGGRLVIPVGRTVWGQTIRVVDKTVENEIRESRSVGVRFVPLVKNEPI